MCSGAVTGSLEAVVCSVCSRKGIGSGLNVSGKLLIMGACRNSFCRKRLRAVGSQTKLSPSALCVVPLEDASKDG